MNSLLMTETPKSCEERQRWQSILGETALLLGEGDFQLSSRLARAGITGFTATELRSEEEVCETYPHAAENIADVRRSGNQVLFGVNALTVHIPEGCTGVFWAHPYPYKGFMNDIYRSLVRRCARRGCDFHVVEKGAEFRPRFGEEMLAGADDLQLTEKDILPGSSIPTWAPVRTKGPVLELIPSDATIVVFKMTCEHAPLLRIPALGGHLSPISESSPTQPEELTLADLGLASERATTWSDKAPGQLQLPALGRAMTWNSVVSTLARLASAAEPDAIKLPATGRSSTWTADLLSNPPAMGADIQLPTMGRSTTWTKPSADAGIKLPTPGRSRTANVVSAFAQVTAGSADLQELRLPLARRASTWTGHGRCGRHVGLCAPLLARSDTVGSSHSTTPVAVC